MVALSAMMLLSTGMGSYAAAGLTLVVNGKKAAAEPQVLNSTTYMPLRAAAELPGASVGYNGAKRLVTITSDTSTLNAFIFALSISFQT